LHELQFRVDVEEGGEQSGEAVDKAPEQAGRKSRFLAGFLDP
jgi:hypothetical protein